MIMVFFSLLLTFEEEVLESSSFFAIEHLYLDAKNHFGVGDFLIKLCIREHREVFSFFGLKSFSRISKEKNTDCDNF